MIFRKKFIFLTFTLLLFTLFFSTSLANSVTPYESEIFDSYSISFSSNKIATFSCDLSKKASSVKVSKCTIQKKVWNASLKKYDWNNVKTLSNVCSSTNSRYLSGSKDLSSYIGSGTYRVYATFVADGESRSITSNECAFK